LEAASLMSEIKNEVSKLMKGVRKKGFPSSAQVVDETFDKLGFLPDKISPEHVQSNFNQILHKVWVETLSVLEDYEENFYPRNVIEALLDLKRDLVQESTKIARTEGFTKAVTFLFQSLYPYLRQVFRSIGQGRMARGGKDFELQFGRLLDLMKIPYQKINRKTRVDFMMPSDALFEKNPTAAAIASAKRTLRERWREVVEELHAMRSPNIFLITADEDVSEGHVRDICGKYRIHLVVWDHVKTKYPKEPLVLSYTEWANNRIPILKQFWGDSQK
jgi:hypothetical protein